VVLEASPAEAVMLRLHMREWLAAQERTETHASSALEWARENATIVLPGRGRVPFEPYAYQAAYLDDAKPRRLILKARQVGMSNVVAIEALYRAITHPDRQILMISRNGLLAQQLITYCRHTLGGLKHQPGIDQTPNGRATCSSASGPGLEGGEWSRHTIHWSDCPRYDEAWAERQREHDPPVVRAGVRLRLHRVGRRVFDPDDLARCLVGWNPEPAGCDRIINAWDIGRRQDHTVGISIGRRTEDRVIGRRGSPRTVKLDVWHEVAYDRLLVPYPVVQDQHRGPDRALGADLRREQRGRRSGDREPDRPRRAVHDDRQDEGAGHPGAATADPAGPLQVRLGAARPRARAVPVGRQGAGAGLVMAAAIALGAEAAERAPAPAADGDRAGRREGIGRDAVGPYLLLVLDAAGQHHLRLPRIRR
jgi:hypothetical protein